MEVDVEVDIEGRHRPDRHHHHDHDCGCDDKWQDAIFNAGYDAETPSELTELLLSLQSPSGTDAVSGTGVATPNNPNLLGA